LSSRLSSAMSPVSSSLSSAMSPVSSALSSAMSPMTSSLSPVSSPQRPMWHIALAVGVLCVVVYLSYKYLWPPLAQMWNTPKLPPPAKKPAAIKPPAKKPDPAPNDTGFCYVGEWQGVRSCVEIKGGACAGDMYPTADLCRDPNLRQ
jgi:hypothetical protein